MIARLNITLDAHLYRRLKKEVPAKGISRFISRAIRASLTPDRMALDAAYRSASREGWRREISSDWAATESEQWPG